MRAAPEVSGASASGRAGASGWVAWGLLGAIVASVAAQVAVAGRNGWMASLDPFSLLVGIPFAAAGAIVAGRQPGNVIGWLLMVPGIGVAVDWVPFYLHGLTGPPEVVTWGLLLALLANGLSWVFLFFPVFFLLLVFPTGRLLSRRWRWLVRLQAAMLAFLVVIGLLSEEVGPVDDAWTVRNPIGVLPASVVEGLFGSVWTVGLITLVVGGLAAIVLRYRRGDVTERLQLRWLLFTTTVFVVVYVLGAVDDAFSGIGIGIGVALGVSMAGIPVSIAVAVIRYRLFDIDVVIRRTLVYAVLSGLLVAVYAGSVVVLREVAGGVTGDGSLPVAVSTLLVAALFAPARRRVQRVIDRRFFRSRYDAAEVVARFADELRRSLALDDVRARAEQVVVDVFAPETVTLTLLDVGSAAAGLPVSEGRQ